ncbi:MAG: hypothetical protein E6G22_07180 [Actinobacteria bacterium]|nr:MAG: hypothetical protein E6G22_07180 [Actinomycetota bacterium]
MSPTLAVLDFLNSREKASLLWVAAIVAFATAKRNGVASSFVAVVRSLLAPKLLAVFGSAALYCAGVVLLARWIGAWHTAALKETIYWFFTGGVVLVGRAVTHAAPFDLAFYKALLRQAVRFTIVVEFLVNLYVFPFLAELFLVPLVLLFVAMQVLAAHDDSLANARKPIEGLLTTIGLLLLAYFVVKAILNPANLFTREHAERLLVAPILTFAFVPLLWAWGWISRREQENLRRGLRASYDSPV